MLPSFTHLILSLHLDFLPHVYFDSIFTSTLSFEKNVDYFKNLYAPDIQCYILLKNLLTSFSYLAIPLSFSSSDELGWGHDGSSDSVFNSFPDRELVEPDSPKVQFVMLPVDKDDYLEPGAAAQSMAYLDLDGSGQFCSNLLYI